MKKKITCRLLTFYFLSIIISSINCDAQIYGFQTWNTSNASAITVNNFRSVTIDKRGKVWAGSDLGGLYVYKNGQWSKANTYPDITFRHLVPSNLPSDSNVWVGSIGKTGAQAITGGAFYINTATEGITQYSTGVSGGLSSRYANSLAFSNQGKIYVALATSLTSGTTNQGGVYSSNTLNPPPPSSTSFTKAIPDVAGTGDIIYHSAGNRGNELWFGRGSNCDGTGFCAAPYIARLSSTGAVLTSITNANSPLPFTNTSTSSFARAIFTDTIVGNTFVGLSSGGIGVCRSNGTWKMLTSSNSPFPTGAAVNFNAIAEVYGEIWIGTTAGIFVYNGYGSLDNISSFKMLTAAANGLPSDGITDIAVDTARSDIWVTSLTGVSRSHINLKAELVWDKSFPTPGIQPKGVAADAVARLYVKVKSSAPLPMQQIEIKIDNNNVSSSANMLGKVMPATIINSYSEEANNANSITSSSTNAVNNEFWFWYVAPDDFSESSTSVYANATDRNVNLKIIGTASNGTKDSINFLVTVVRPPLVMVHGLGGDVKTWSKFNYGTNTLFTGSTLFKQVKAIELMPHASYLTNADILLGSSINSLSGNINLIRDKGYACNQVDYVCHSMGGCILRTAMTIRSNKFLGKGNEAFKNYQKGFIHKAITLNTPHNNSPFADAIATIIPLVQSGITKTILESGSYFKGDFFEHEDPNDSDSKLVATPAVKDLQVINGVKLSSTNVRDHLIYGDIDINDLKPLPTFSIKQIGRFLDILCKTLRDNTSVNIQNVLNPIIGMEDPFDKALAFMNWYSDRIGYPNFFQESDFIVPVKSQIAGENELNNNHLQIFKDTDPSNDNNAHHLAITDRTDVGNHTLNLLNSGVNTNLFGSSISAMSTPATIQPIPITPRTVNSFFNKIKVKINSLLHNRLRNENIITNTIDTVKIGDTLNIQFQLMDTADLAYVDIEFQAQSKTSINHSNVQSKIFIVDSDFVGIQTVSVTAIYDRPSGVSYYTDTLYIYVKAVAPLLNFIVEPTLKVLPKEQLFYPDYKAVYTNYSVPVIKNNPDLNVSIGDTSILRYNTGLNAFVVITDTGSTYAIITYKGFSDTILFTAIPGIYYGCTNRTIASGNWDDPVIWEKGIIPNTCDSVIITPGKTIAFNSSVQVRALNISAGGILNIFDSTKTLQIGEGDDGNRYFVNNGTLNISAGKLIVNGRLQQTAGSTFNMTEGKIIIDGNTSFTETSILSGLHLFDISGSMANFSFIGGTLQFIDPPIGDSSQTINCPYDFGDNTILKFGDGISTTSSKNSYGFGGNLLPAKIGKLVLDAATMSNNRIFTNLNPLTVKSSVQVKSGNLVQKALIQVIQ